MLTEYTTPESVRALLGVTDRELPDTVLYREVYLFALRAELREIDPDLMAGYATAVSGTSDADRLLVETVRLFSAHAVAVKVAGVLSQVSPRTIGEGKALLVRHSAGDLEKVVAEVRAEYVRARKLLQTVYTGTTVVSEQRPLMAVSNAGYDPVTGE